MRDEQYIKRCVLAACLMECTARKPGNVHPEHSFEDLKYEHFVASAHAVAPILAKYDSPTLGNRILNAVSTTNVAVGRNTNLGIVLLLGALCHVPYSVRLNNGIVDVLNSTTIADATDVYKAIRLTNPKGLGKSDKQDVANEPTVTLIDSMKLAANRDSIAEEYVTHFKFILEQATWLAERYTGNDDVDNWGMLIQSLQVRILAARPDTLIVRKLGPKAAQQVTDAAKEIEISGGVFTHAGNSRFQLWAEEMRALGRDYNPGTTADFIAAILFAAFRERLLPLPQIDQITTMIE
ncbi:triphosphoribosyl-dephospho-CoA synthase [Calycomorphotria hydatis]|uniref:Triphosphoribosyl-dephospho-CoA synthase n=1 Tax=Calycomorphotria hydatis TaxID=2528027 RepID=A0A517TAK5_9PLAN|nr:triphosphoribosyl-dephospho-CoA synthase [Calycomorphotria hydatis]QDT65405.1 triphosphoribosyl-dephospho-CoA synthase [Calycomorphotria hydatis]